MNGVAKERYAPVGHGATGTEVRIAMALIVPRPPGARGS